VRPRAEKRWCATSSRRIPYAAIQVAELAISSALPTRASTGALAEDAPACPQGVPLGAPRRPRRTG
jgi:hypothetical protein